MIRDARRVDGDKAIIASMYVNQVWNIASGNGPLSNLAHRDLKRRRVSDEVAEDLTVRLREMRNSNLGKIKLRMMRKNLKAEQEIGRIPL